MPFCVAVYISLPLLFPFFLSSPLPYLSALSIRIYFMQVWITQENTHDTVLNPFSREVWKSPRQEKTGRNCFSEKGAELDDHTVVSFISSTHDLFMLLSVMVKYFTLCNFCCLATLSFLFFCLIHLTRFTISVCLSVSPFLKGWDTIFTCSCLV